MSNFGFVSKIFEAADISAVFVLFGLMVLITQMILCFHVEACNEVTTHWATHTHTVLSLYVERRLGSSAVRLISFSRGIQVKPSNGTVFLAAGQGDDLVLRDTDLFFHLHLAPPSLLHCKKKKRRKNSIDFSSLLPSASWSKLSNAGHERGRSCMYTHPYSLKGYKDSRQLRPVSRQCCYKF